MGLISVARKPLPDKATLQRLFSYDSETGLFTFLPRSREMFAHCRDADGVCASWNKRRAHKPALNSKKNSGYLCGFVDGVVYQAHRVAWKIVHGTEPQFVDHINGNKADNRICNLRSVSHSENMRNQRRQCRGRSGIVGVIRTSNGKWQARIGVNNGRGDQRISLGVFRTQEEAIAARKAGEALYGYGGGY